MTTAKANEKRRRDIPSPRTPDESADIIQRLDDLVAKSETPIVEGIQEFQAKHTGYMRKNYGRFMGQFEMYFAGMTDYAHNINYFDKQHWPANRGLQFIIMTFSLKQLHSAYDLLVKGVYEDAITVIRSSYESFLRIVFISCNPKYASNAYKSPGQKGQPQFNATNFIKDELGLEWTTYNITSAFAHSNMYKVMEVVTLLNSGEYKKPINLNYEIDKDMVDMTINSMNFLLDAFLAAYDQLFTIDISAHKSKDKLQIHLDKLHEYASICHESLRGHSANEHWRMVAVDLEHIFELMKTMDADSSLVWKDEWHRISSTR